MLIIGCNGEAVAASLMIDLAHGISVVLDFGSIVTLTRHLASDQRLVLLGEIARH